MRTRLLLCSAGLLATVVMAQGPRDHGFGMRGGQAYGASRTPVTGAPYSAVETVQTQQLLANGNQISHSEQSNVYRDSQGRTRTERTITPPASSGRQPFTEITIVDPVAGYRYELNSSTMTAVQTTLPPPKTSAGNGTRRAPPSGAGQPTVATASLGTQTVNGVTATGTQVTETIPAGAFGNAQPIQIVRVTWISTDLKIPVQVKSSDPRFGNRDLEVTITSTAEPAGTLFVVPSGYTVTTGHGRFPGGPGHKT
jgi:hypothetical protein